MVASASSPGGAEAEAELSQQVVGKEPCPIRITVLQFQLHSSSCHDMPSFVMGASSLLSVGPTSFSSSSGGAEAELPQPVVGQEPCPIRITVHPFQLHSSSCHAMPSFVMGASSLLCWPH